LSVCVLEPDRSGLPGSTTGRGCARWVPNIWQIYSAFASGEFPIAEDPCLHSPRDRAGRRAGRDHPQPPGRPRRGRARPTPKKSDQFCR